MTLNFPGKKFTWCLSIVVEYLFAFKFYQNETTKIHLAVYMIGLQVLADVCLSFQVQFYIARPTGSS